MRLLLALASTLAALAAAAPALAGVPADWRATGPWGGPVSALEIPDPDGNRAYALTYGGLYRSDDRGATWALTPSPNPSVRYHVETRFAVTRADPDRVVLVHGDQGFISSDGALSWTELDLAAAAAPAEYVRYVDSVALHPVDADRFTVFLRVRETTLRNRTMAWTSSDAGSTHAATLVPEISYCHRPSSGPVFAAAYTADQLFFLHQNDCQFDTQTVARIWDGATLASVGSTATGEILVLGQHVLSRSGTTVTSVPIGGGQVAVLRNDSMRVQALADGSVVSGARDGLFRSTDAGVNWTRISNASFGMGGSESLFAVTAAQFAKPQRWLAGNEDGLFATVDSGGTWTFSSFGLSAFNLRAVTVDPVRPYRYWVGVGEHWDGRYANQEVLYRTTSDGGSWQVSNIATMAERLRDIVVDPDTTSDPQSTHLYASGSGCPQPQPICNSFQIRAPGLYRSVDGGATWSPMADIVLGQPTFKTHRTLALIPNVGSVGARKLLVNSSWPTHGLVATSVDSGASWTITSTGLPDSQVGNSWSSAIDMDVARANPNRVYLSTTTRSVAYQPPTDPSGVFVSDDGGVSWTHRANGLPEFSLLNAFPGTLSVASHPLDADTAWAVTTEHDAYRDLARGRVFRTIDAGLTWQEASDGLPSDYHVVIAADPTVPGQLYLGTTSGVFWSDDSASSWQRLGSTRPGHVQAIAVGVEDIYVAGLRGVHRIARPRRDDPIACPGANPPGGLRPLSAQCSGRISGAL